MSPPFRQLKWNPPVGWFLHLPMHLLIYQPLGWLHLPHMYHLLIPALEWLHSLLMNLLMSPRLGWMCPAPTHFLLDSQLGLLHLHQCSLCKGFYSGKKFLIFKCEEIIFFWNICVGLANPSTVQIRSVNWHFIINALRNDVLILMEGPLYFES